MTQEVRGVVAQISGAAVGVAIALTGTAFGGIGLAVGVLVGVPVGWTVAALLGRRGAGVT